MGQSSRGVPCFFSSGTSFDPVKRLFLRREVRHRALAVGVASNSAALSASRPEPWEQGRLESSDGSIATAEGAEELGSWESFVASGSGSRSGSRGKRYQRQQSRRRHGFGQISSARPSRGRDAASGETRGEWRATDAREIDNTYPRQSDKVMVDRHARSETFAAW
ncbi:hypothetical protein HDV57DRAFT_452120 [Trichoderma longibrachiatum]|uniref:Uncharacterized protein n=1 Tax=Trichoderma longibrachiatum ATCC 18648 TaxID=983965 RepID=A0A2T4CGP5_TRILO|nr:hypothetical protein M440DRAFT_1133980 [Trichoderma longibrachiatum ATCC 18648]